MKNIIEKFYDVRSVSFLDTKGGKWWGAGGGVMNWEIGIDIYTLICIK